MTYDTNDTNNSMAIVGGASSINYYIFGVSQHVPGVQHIGLLFAIAEALDTPMQKLIKQLIDMLREDRSLYDTLLNGSLRDYYHSYDDFIDSIRDLFIFEKMFAREYQIFNQWSEVFIELFQLLFNIGIFVFIDETGHGNAINLFIPPRLLSEINQYGVENKQYVIVIKKQNKYYPIFVIDAERYFKTGRIITRVYPSDNNVIKLILSMIQFNPTFKYGQKMNLLLVNEFMAGGKGDKYRLLMRYINKQNLCYACVLGTGNGSSVYVSIDYSAYVMDKTPISFDAFEPNKSFTQSALSEFIVNMNKFILSHYKVSENVYVYAQLVPGKYIKHNDKIIGRIINDMIFYFDANSDVTSDDATTDIKYNYLEINKKILEKAPAMEDPRSRLIGQSLYTNYQYQLFVIEFIGYLDKERNTALRKLVIDEITSTDFSKDISGFIKKLRSQFKDYPADYGLIQSQIMTFYYTYFDKKVLIDNITNTIYDFDHITMNKLKLMSHDEIKSELKVITSNFIIEQKLDTVSIQFPNIYLPCSDMSTNPGYCDSKHRLILDGVLDDFIDIMAADIKNDLKSRYLLSGIFADTTLSYLQFIQVPTEIITIYRLAE